MIRYWEIMGLKNIIGEIQLYCDEDIQWTASIRTDIEITTFTHSSSGSSPELL